MSNKIILDEWDRLSLRDRDAWVAQQIFNYKLTVVNDDDDYHYYHGEGDLEGYSPLPFYTTDVSDAWLIVEKIHNIGGCDIGCYGKGEHKWFTVEITSPKNGLIKHTDNTVAKAICKTALLAVLQY